MRYKPERENQSIEKPGHAGPSRTRPTIGFLADSVWMRVSQYATMVWTGIADAARAHDANLICFPGGMLGDSPFDEFNAQRRVLYDLVTPDTVDGLVIGSGTLSLFVSPQELEDFCVRFRPLPMVGIATAIAGFPSVLVDNVTGLRDTIDHLIETHGYRRIACLRGSERHQEAEERYRAYTEALAAHGLTLDLSLVVCGDFSRLSGTAAMRTLLDERQLRPGVDFDAVVAVADEMALGALHVLQARGIQVPYDVAVVGFDDIAEASVSIPTLTTVRQPIHAQTQRAVEMLLAGLVGEAVPEQVTLPTEMVVRQSCGCHSQAVAEVRMPHSRSARAVTEQAFDSRRDEIVAAMVQAVTSSVPEATRAATTEWAEQLLDAFAVALKDGAPDGFLATLDHVLRESGMIDGHRSSDGAELRSGARVGAWQGALSALRRHAAPGLGRAALRHAEDLWQQARVMIGETTGQTEASRRILSEVRSEVLVQVSQVLTSAAGVTELMDTLVKELPRLGIRSCYLSLYLDPRAPAAGSNLELAYRDGERVAVEEKKRRFASRQLVPTGILPAGRPYQLISEPLHFREEHLGLVLFEFEEGAQQDGLISETLRGLLSSALNRIRLLQTRTEAEEALAQERNLLRSLIDNMPDYVYVKDTESRFIIANPALARLFRQTSPSALVGKTDFDFFPHDMAAKFFTDEQALFQSGQTLDENEKLIVDAAGNQRWVSTTKVPLRDGRGNLIGLVGSGRDITERKRSEEVLRRRAVQLQTAAEAARLITSSGDIDQVLHGVVELIQRRFQYYHVNVFLIDDAGQSAVLRAASGEVSQRLLEDGIKLPLGGQSIIGWVTQNGQPRISQDVDTDPLYLPVALLVNTRAEAVLPLLVGGKVIGALDIEAAQPNAFPPSDVTILNMMADQIAVSIENVRLFEQTSLAREQAEARVREMQVLQRVIRAASVTLDLEHVLDALFDMLSREMGFTYLQLTLIDESANQVRTVRATGLAQGMNGLVRALDQMQDDILMDVARKGQIEVIDGWDERFDREIFEREGHAALVRAFVPLLLQAKPIGILEVGYLRQERAVITPEEIRLLGGLGDQIAVAVQNARLHTDEKARARELGQAYQTLKENQEKLLISEKMASLGRLTAGIAHEMNTPLAAVRASLVEMNRLVTEYHNSIGDPQVTPDDHREIVQEMQQALRLAESGAKRTADFVRGVKTQTRDLASHELQRFNAVPVIEEALLLLSHPLRKSSCTATFEPTSQDIQLTGSPGRLAQVITNLVTNSIDASVAKGGGPIELQMSQHDHRIALEVSDQGSGILPENLSRIFDPMFTTKPFGQGTGLGLTIVHDIVVGQFGGTIEVTSQLGQGATFRLEFPNTEGVP